MKAAIFMADGFETCEGLIVVDMFRRARVDIDLISMNETLAIMTSQRVEIKSEKLFRDINCEDYDILILPGGKVGTKNLESSEELKAALRRHFEEGKLTCAICAAPSIFGHMGLLKGKKYTCFPEFDEASFSGEYQQELAVKDGNLVTGRGMGATIEFAMTILRSVVDEKTMNRLMYGTQYEHAFRTVKKPE